MLPGGRQSNGQQSDGQQPNGQQPNGPQPGAQTPGRMGMGVMPSSPTEAAPPGTPGTPGLSPPTQPKLGEEGAAGGGGAAGAGYMPMAPTYRRPAPPMSIAASPYSAFTEQQTLLSAAWSPQKAFANYQPPSSGVSPYMNLFRTGTNNGTIDNYTTLVRPALQQQSANQTFGTDIFGLQRSERIQSMALQQVDRSARTLQGVGTPQYYLNSGMPQPYMTYGYGGNVYGGSNYGGGSYGGGPYGSNNYGGYYPGLGQ